MHCSTKCERLQCRSWVVDFLGGEGEVGGGVGEGVGGREGRGVGDGLLEEFFGFGGAVEAEWEDEGEEDYWG